MKYCCNKWGFLNGKCWVVYEDVEGYEVELLNIEPYPTNSIRRLMRFYYCPYCGEYLAGEGSNIDEENSRYDWYECCDDFFDISGSDLLYKNKEKYYVYINPENDLINKPRKIKLVYWPFCGKKIGASK